MVQKQLAQKAQVLTIKLVAFPIDFVDFKRLAMVDLSTWWSVLLARVHVFEEGVGVFHVFEAVFADVELVQVAVFLCGT